MLTINQLLLWGLKANPPAPTESNLEEFADGKLGSLESLLVAGFITALYDRSADAEAWLSDAGKKLQETIGAVRATSSTMMQTVDWNSYFIGRWGAVGDVDALRELIRRAKNRDGSPESAEMSTGALVAFSEVQDNPQMAAVLAANGFNPASLKFGSHPVGSDSAFVVGKVSTTTRRVTPPVKRAAPAAPAAAAPEGEAAPAGDAAAAPAAPQPPPGFVPTPFPGARAPRPGPARRPSVVGSLATPDLVSGTVRISGAAVGIGAAIALAQSIVSSVRALVIPEDGYTWVDDAADPQSKSTLILLDVARGKGLPENQDLGGLVRAEVTQDSGGTPGSTSVSYSNRLFLRNGTTQNAGGFADIHAAQSDIARRVSALPNGDLLTEAELAQQIKPGA